MRTITEQVWTDANQSYLMAAIAATREQIAGSTTASKPAVTTSQPRNPLFAQTPPALEQLCSTFRLSSFERSILLACAGMELDAQFAPSCAEAQPGRPAGPAFALLFSTSPEAHWDAISPAGPLRHWRLIEMGNGPTLMTSSLRIDECILHYLTGTPYLDQRLNGILEPIGTSEKLPPSQQTIAQRVATLWAASPEERRPVLIELNGADQATRQAVAASACNFAGLPVNRIFAGALPLQHAEIHALIRLVEREAMLNGSAVLLDCDGSDMDAARKNALHFFVEGLNSPLIVSTPQRMSGHLRQATFLEIEKPLMEEQRTAWQATLGPAAASMNGSMDVLLSQFDMSIDQIRTSGLRVACKATATEEQILETLWESCRVQARPSLDELAQRVETTAGWDALVLPGPQLQMLRDVATQMRHRSRVYQAWGFGGSSGRGLGITALFAGVSGTGKTTAAEVLAHELKLDLYRIDLSQVVSKYIGETEKSLRRIFDAAEQGGALLFFDEADALFGRRTEVKDSHDRYANIEVSYLLQRMESYRGLAVLATNMKQALDPAFMRRIRFVVQFPFPDATLRQEIWRRMIPQQAPTEALDLEQLSRLTVTGGNIRNIALGAAFLAVRAGEPIRMNHLLEAARGEYLKIEKPLTEPEIRGWV